jgi:hypothetical protein
MAGEGLVAAVWLDMGVRGNFRIFHMVQAGAQRGRPIKPGCGRHFLRFFQIFQIGLRSPSRIGHSSRLKPGSQTPEITPTWSAVVWKQFHTAVFSQAFSQMPPGPKPIG